MIRKNEQTSSLMKLTLSGLSALTVDWVAEEFRANAAPIFLQKSFLHDFTTMRGLSLPQDLRVSPRVLP
ncbi:MAG: hypothetical protein ACJAS7_000970 [Alpinimonas sp.]|jgi:hypothetical protein